MGAAAKRRNVKARKVKEAKEVKAIGKATVFGTTEMSMQKRGQSLARRDTIRLITVHDPKASWATFLGVELASHIKLYRNFRIR